MISEIELRAKVDENTFASIKQEVEKHGSISIQTRCFIDYSTFVEGIGERRLDVRVRVTNGVPEIVVKRGIFGAAVREEAAARVVSEDLEKALSVMALLGYEKGVMGGRRIHRGMIGDVEVAAQEVLDFNQPSVIAERFVEVEYIGASTDHKVAESSLRNFLEERKIKPFTIPEWNLYIAELNKKWNGVYEHGNTSVSSVRELGS